ncbi:uncharacterized protein LTR77_003399 [Saxophila tyrrhenica]|uniref:Uncharacterized protein n=1 Tax=Saxophila tyrrhenica TaxID=1690608 RepID=A0AAV9PG37_9PEZI|nr:hypothetical protein LTR77_003399 [Saxophila tyrrhenica]
MGAINDMVKPHKKDNKFEVWEGGRFGEALAEALELEVNNKQRQTEYGNAPFRRPGTTHLADIGHLGRHTGDKVERIGELYIIRSVRVDVDLINHAIQDNPNVNKSNEYSYKKQLVDYQSTVQDHTLTYLRMMMLRLILPRQMAFRYGHAFRAQK